MLLGMIRIVTRIVIAWKAVRVLLKEMIEEGAVVRAGAGHREI
jgi:hypothetical protein